jgi:hypothetical protein
MPGAYARASTIAVNVYDPRLRDGETAYLVMEYLLPGIITLQLTC